MTGPKTESMSIESNPWHHNSIESAILQLKTDRVNGLSDEEAEQRLFRFGKNALEETRRRSVFRMFLDHFTDFMILVLIGAAIIAGFLGEPEDTIAIVAIVILNAILGFTQEYRAEKAMAALKALAAPIGHLIRDAKHVVVPAHSIVPGDIVRLSAGDVIPADVRLLETNQLKLEEASLTGESHPVEKEANCIAPLDAPIGDRANMAYKGTLITYGRGVGVVTATGMHTELGRIASLLSVETDTKTPLQKRLARFGQRLAIAVIAICAVIFMVGLLRGEGLVLMFMTALSLAVAAIPEALPAVVTVSLALGARRMARKKALIRRLPAVETLGSVTFICSDKTGTLTQNKMQVDAGSLEQNELQGHALTALIRAMGLNNDASRAANGSIEGDPTEVALLECSQGAGFPKADLEKEFPRVDEIPFSSERGQMTTLHQTPSGDILVITKGSPEQVVSKCKYAWKNGEKQAINQQAELERSVAMARSGLRVLAFAEKLTDSVPDETHIESIEADFTLLGLVGLIDPPRPEAKAAIQLCQTAAIHVVMITGDHPATALAIARELGIINEATENQGLHGPVLTGKELAEITLEELESRVKHIRVYARVTPEQKIKIVKALQDTGEVVAMTGDGVNDAPALKKADIGVAMGEIGTDVAREASHMVLLDDNFTTIVSAVREGRRIFDNIRKFVKFALTGNAGEIWTLFLAPFLGLPIPLLPIHILWVNLVTDGLPGLALAAEPQEKNLMERPPRQPSESIFAHGLWQHTIWVGLLIGAVTLSVMAWAYQTGHAHWQSMVFTVLTLSQMGHVLAVRSEHRSLFQQGLFSNRPLLAAVIVTFALQMTTLYVPFFNSVFKTEPLTLSELFICIAASTIVFFAVEIEKLLVRRFGLYGEQVLAS